LVKVNLKNSSILPKKLTLIFYTLGDVSNATQVFWMWPRGTKSLEFKEGTKVYLVHQKQVDTVMTGKRIDSEKPFLVVDRNSENRIYKF